MHLFSILMLGLIQDPSADQEVQRLLRGLSALRTRPMENPDELDRRYLALEKLVAENEDFKSRQGVLTWLPGLALKTGRPQAALDAVVRLLESPKTTPREAERWMTQGLLYAFLTAKSSAVDSYIRAVARKYPESTLAKNREGYVKTAKVLGRRGASISLPTLDGRRFSWRSETNGKIVVLYFCASW